MYHALVLVQVNLYDIYMASGGWSIQTNMFPAVALHVVDAADEILGGNIRVMAESADEVRVFLASGVKMESKH